MAEFKSLIQKYWYQSFCYVFGGQGTFLGSPVEPSCLMSPKEDNVLDED